MRLRRPPHLPQPDLVRRNCRRLGLPAPYLAMPMIQDGGDLVRDVSGNGWHGTYVETSLRQDSRYGWVPSFDGIDGYVNLPAGAMLDTSMPFTVRLIYVREIEEWNVQAVLSLETDGDVWSFISADFATFLPYSFGSSTTWAKVRNTDNASPVLGKWMDMVVCYDGVSPTARSSFQIYENESEKPTLDAGAFPPLGSANRLAQSPSDQYEFGGRLARVEVWNDHALTREQVRIIQSDPYAMYRKTQTVVGVQPFSPYFHRTFIQPRRTA